MNTISINTDTDYVVYVDGAARHWVSRDDFNHWQGKYTYLTPEMEIRRRFQQVYPDSLVHVK